MVFLVNQSQILQKKKQLWVCLFTTTASKKPPPKIFLFLDGNCSKMASAESIHYWEKCNQGFSNMWKHKSQI